MACSAYNPQPADSVGRGRHSDGTVFCVYGFPFRLRTNHPRARRLFGRLYGHFLEPGATEMVTEAVLEQGRGWVSWALGEKTGSETDLSKAMWGLESVLCEAVIRSQQRSIAVHAAGIMTNDSVTLLVGRGGAEPAP